MKLSNTKTPSIRLPNPVTVPVTTSTHFMCSKAGCRNSCAECARVEPDTYPMKVRLNGVQPVAFPPPNPECPGYIMLPWGIFQHAVDLKLHGWLDSDLLVVRFATTGYEARVVVDSSYVPTPSEYVFALGELIDAMPMPSELPSSLRLKMQDFDRSDVPWRQDESLLTTEANKAQTGGSTLNAVQPPNGVYKLRWERDPFHGGVAYYAYDYDNVGVCYAVISGEYPVGEVESNCKQWAIAITAPYKFYHDAPARLSVTEPGTLESCQAMVESWLLPEPGAETTKPEVTALLVDWTSRALARMGFGCLAIVPSMTDDGDLMLERQDGPVILLSPTSIEDDGRQVPAWDVLRPCVVGHLHDSDFIEESDVQHLCTLLDFREAFSMGVRFVNDAAAHHAPLPRGANPAEDAEDDRLAADDYVF